jgi:hypothetical protein
VEELRNRQVKNYSASVTRVDLHRLRLQRITETLARAWRVEMKGARVDLVFRCGAGAPIKRDGMELMPDEIGLLPPGSSAWVTQCGPGELGTISFHVEDLLDLSVALVGQDPLPAEGATAARVAAGPLRQLRSLHAAVSHLAKTSPEIISNPDAARGLEASLIDTAVACLAQGSMLADTDCCRRHTRIMKHFLELTEASHGQAVCRLGVTQRTFGCRFPETAWDRSKALSAAAPSSSGAAGASCRNAAADDSDRDRNKIWLLGIWSLRGFLPRKQFREPLGWRHRPDEAEATGG